MKRNNWKITASWAVALLAPGLLSLAEENGNSWIDGLKSMGEVYSNENNAAVQEIEIFGRAHYQWNYSDGKSDGQTFSGNGDELRRLRAGTSVKFLDGFTALARLNLEKGGFRNTSLGYSSFDELYLDYSLGEVWGMDSASIGYGRYKVLFGGEEHESSKRIKTIERSNINNRFGSLRPTGLLFKGEKSGTEYSAGLFSTESDRETWAKWKGGTAFYASAGFDALAGDILLDFMHANDSANDQSIFDFKWATSATYQRSFDQFDFLANATYSQTDSGSLWGIVLMPSTFLIPDKLEAVGRYQYSHSSGEGAVPRSSSSRGLRRVARNEGLGTGAGDANHTFYAGLNYFLEGHYSKLMTGVEYEIIDGEIGRDLDGFTFWTAYRFYF